MLNNLIGKRNHQNLSISLTYNKLTTAVVRVSRTTPQTLSPWLGFPTSHEGGRKKINPAGQRPRRGENSKINEHLN